MTSSADATAENSENEEQQSEAEHENQEQYPVTPCSQTIAFMPSADYVMPYGHVGVGHAMGQIMYPSVDGVYGGIYGAYGGQAVIPPHLVGMPHASMPLPTEAVEEPVYVNPKQYNAILRRRQIRAKAESENKVVKGRKPYLHESRHLHALKRARGSGGRFLNAKSEGNTENSKSGDEQNGSTSNDEVQSSAKSVPDRATAVQNTKPSEVSDPVRLDASSLGNREANQKEAKP